MRRAGLVLTCVLVTFWSSAGWSQPMVTGAAPEPDKNFFFSTWSGFPPPPVIVPALLIGMRAAHLSAAQQKQIGEILRSSRSRTAPWIQQLQLVHEQIANRLLAPGHLSAADLAPLEDKVVQLDGEIQREALAASIKIRGVLRDDQVARMAQFHQKMFALQQQIQKLMRETAQQAATEPTS